MSIIDDTVARIPFLAFEKDLRIIPLSGGITNHNFRVDVGDSFSCVIRINGLDTEMLGIRREAEHAASKAAGELGIAPKVLYLVEPERYLVTRFVRGKSISPKEMATPSNISRVVMNLRRFHQEAPPLPVEFNVFRRIEMLIRVSQLGSCKFPENFDFLIEKMYDVEATLKKNPYTARPCHNDLLNLNFLDEEGRLYILDWEYAGMGDIFFDLANFSHHHQLTDDLSLFLLKEYFGLVDQKLFARLKLIWSISEIHEAMWGTAQTAISKLDVDFKSYAELWFKRATEDLLDPRHKKWLIDAAIPLSFSFNG